MKTIEELKTDSVTGKLPDEENPLFAFSLMSTTLLSEFARGSSYDIDYFLRYELANRGLDINGRWIGFAAAKKEFKL
jgi:hypothetical protein